MKVSDLIQEFRRQRKPLIKSTFTEVDQAFIFKENVISKLNFLLISYTKDQKEDKKIDLEKLEKVIKDFEEDDGEFV